MLEQAGAKTPPVVVFGDGKEYWVADGFHRVKAAIGASLEKIACQVHKGTLDDAKTYSGVANWFHDLQRIREDRERGVTAVRNGDLFYVQITRPAGCDGKKRQEMIENAAKRRRILDVLSQAQGLCQELTEVEISAVTAGWTSEGMRAWERAARESAVQLRLFAAKLGSARVATKRAAAKRKKG
jgi:hypothetical protein